jgi:hypothetical protein
MQTFVLNKKGLEVTNTLAYYTLSSTRSLKSFCNTGPLGLVSEKIFLFPHSANQ